MRGRARVACVAVCRMAAVTRMRRPRSRAVDALFTGKPHVDGLGYAFLFRNYRPGLGKWQTADPLGYPDGWNQLAYCGNGVTDVIDFLGGWVTAVHHDINLRWLSQNEYTPVDQYLWGVRTIMVLSIMNQASDWTAEWEHQRDEYAYMHGMRSSPEQSFQDAATAYYNYLVSCRQNAMYYSDLARSAYAAYNDAAAYSLENTAIFYLGCLVHTFTDAMSPSHVGFQYFSLLTAPMHAWNERYDVYDSQYRSSVLAELNDEYLGLLRYVLRQPHRE